MHKCIIKATSHASICNDMRVKNDRIQTVWWTVPLSGCVCLLSCSIIVCKCFKIKSLVFPMCLTLWKHQADIALLIHPDNPSTLFSLFREPALTRLFFLLSFPQAPVLIQTFVLQTDKEIRQILSRFFQPRVTELPQAGLDPPAFGC